MKAIAERAHFLSHPPWANGGTTVDRVIAGDAKAPRAPARVAGGGRLWQALALGLLVAASAGAAGTNDLKGSGQGGATNTPIVIRECKPGVVYATNDIVARVDGRTLTWDQMEKRARNYLKDEVDARALNIPSGGEEKALAFFRRKAVTLFVNKEVMLAEARRRGLGVSATAREKFVSEMEGLIQARNLASSLEDFFQKSPLGPDETRREFEDGLVVDRLIQTAVREKVTVTDADREALAVEIIAKRREAKEKADALRAQLVKGDDFTALAENEKREDKRIMTGDLGTVTRGQLSDKVVEEAVFGQDIGEIGPVLNTARGCMIIRVRARAEATPELLATARASFILVRMPPDLKEKETEQVIQARKFDKELQAFLASLRAKARIETIFKDLQFPEKAP